MTVAIVTTQRTWTPESEPWANYHLSLGFTKIYVFVDDGRADYLPSSPAVQLIPTSREYWESHTPNEWQHYLADVRRDYGAQDFGSPENLTKRQVLNANAGLAMAIANGIDWILHIDDDEYFWCPDSSADQHFDALTRAGVNNVVYLNHEAVLFGPETPPEKRCRTVFKKNWTALWEHQRNNIHQVLPGKPYFSCYSNGKAAARCLPGITVPNGAHSMWINDPIQGRQPVLQQVPVAGYVLHRDPVGKTLEPARDPGQGPAAGRRARPGRTAFALRAGGDGVGGGAACVGARRLPAPA
jgi:hypothetical protein